MHASAWPTRASNRRCDQNSKISPVQGGERRGEGLNSAGHRASHSLTSVDDLDAGGAAEVITDEVLFF